MFKIELTRGLGWNSPALAVILTMERYLGDAEKFARQLLKGWPLRKIFFRYEARSQLPRIMGVGILGYPPRLSMVSGAQHEHSKVLPFRTCIEFRRLRLDASPRLCQGNGLAAQ
jgi:hypothetical protein